MSQLKVYDVTYTLDGRRRIDEVMAPAPEAIGEVLRAHFGDRKVAVLEAELAEELSGGKVIGDHSGETVDEEEELEQADDDLDG